MYGDCIIEIYFLSCGSETITAIMFIRQVKKKNTKNGKTFIQYQLCQASRVNGKVKQQSILYLGSPAILSDQESRKAMLKVLQALIFGQSTLFTSNFPASIVDLAKEYHQKFIIKYKDINLDDTLAIPAAENKVKMESVHLDSLEVEEVKTFGCEHLCIQIMKRLDLASCLDKEGFTDKQTRLAQVSIIARAIFTASEHKTAQILTYSSELQNMLGFQDEAISHYSLYKIADQLYDNRVNIDKFLYKKITNMFNLKDTLVIYDLSNTYFEGRKSTSELAKHGRSKEKRNDCKQVVFTGIINPEGFIRHSRVYEGNKADIATVEQMVEDLKLHSENITDKVVVMDAGFASEQNLKYLQDNQLKYVCVSRTRPKDFTLDQPAKTISVTDNRNNPIELKVFNPKNYTDTWLYVKSEQKRVKEQSMADKLEARFIDELKSLQDGLAKKGTTKKIEKVWERLGRIKEKNKGVSARFDIDIEQENELATNIKWTKKARSQSTTKTYGEYFIRTNIENAEEKKLWQAYNTIREVESTFRCLKSDLMLRPVHHQKDHRVEAHIYLAMLAYQLVNTIRHMLKKENINLDWRNVMQIMKTQTIQSVTVNAETKKVCLRKPARPMKEALDIYKATNTKSTIPTVKKYVVYH